MNMTDSPIAPPGNDEHLAAIFAALSHPARIRILRHLAVHAACNCKQVVGEVKLAQSTVSQHLKVLVDAGLILFEPRQQQSCYSIAPDALALLAQSVVRLTDECCSCRSTQAPGNIPNGQ
jgi:ArsR family transcriptional regulator, arsenate/arsenite/antimonite-responsive transcriptional repressor